MASVLVGAALLVTLVALVIVTVVLRRHGAQEAAAAEAAAAETEARGVLESAERRAQEIADTTRAELEAEGRTLREELRTLREDLERRETRLAEREQRLDAEVRRVEEWSGRLAESGRDLETRKEELGRVEDERRQVLEATAGLTADQAKRELVSAIENQAKRESIPLTREIENAARAEGRSAPARSSRWPSSGSPASRPPSRSSRCCTCRATR